MLFDNGLQAKYAYWGIVDPLQLPGADLAVGLSADPDPVRSGSPLTYGIAVTNNGQESAANVALETVLPAGTGFQSLVAPADWSCVTPAVGESGSLSCTTVAMAAGAAAQFSVTALVACGTPDCTALSASATVTSETRDPNPAPNNSATISALVSNPPPSVLDLDAHPGILWPANHKLRLVTLTYGIEDNCDAGIVPVSRSPTTRRRGSDATIVPRSTGRCWIRIMSCCGRRSTRSAGTVGSTPSRSRQTDSAGSMTSSSTEVGVPLRPWWWPMLQPIPFGHEMH